MHFFKFLAITLMAGSLAYAEVNVTPPFKASCSKSGPTYKSSCSKPAFTLSLQAIQSNFLGPIDPTGGNNGLPIPGMSIPTVISVGAHKHGNKITLQIQPFSFTLTADGFMISEDVLPYSISPVGAKWIDFSAGAGVEGHVFRDGSIRFSGPDNIALTAGTYNVPSSKVSFSQKVVPSHAKGFCKYNGTLVRTDNFPISQGQTDLGGDPPCVNNSFDYGEYYGLTFFKGNIYTTTTDNSFDESDTPIIVFNELNKEGKHLITQVDVVSPGYANIVEPETGCPQLGEESLSINPTNTQQLATTLLSFHSPIPTQEGYNLFITNDGGATWNFVDAFANLGTLPTLPGFTPPLEASDQQCVFDGFGNLFYVSLSAIATFDFSTITLVAYVVMSPDGGNTWTLVDFITKVNPLTFGLDYPKIGTGPGPNGSFVTWVMLKQDISFDEIVNNGSTLPLMTAAYQTTGKGVVSNKSYQEIPSSENGGYGTIAVGPKGDVLVVGSATNNTLGSLPSTNTSIWYAYDQKGIEGTFSPAKVVANSNTGYNIAYLPQQNRSTWAHPNAVIDNNGRFYLLYVDQPTPHLTQPNPNIFLIYSDDKGEHWSTPIRINNDVRNTTFHIMPELYVDPFSNDLAITWLDSREDQLDASTRLWGTVIKHGSLPKLKH